MSFINWDALRRKTNKPKSWKRHKINAPLSAEECITKLDLHFKNLIRKGVDKWSILDDPKYRYNYGQSFLDSKLGHNSFIVVREIIKMSGKYHRKAWNWCPTVSHYETLLKDWNETQEFTKKHLEKKKKDEESKE